MASCRASVDDLLGCIVLQMKVDSYLVMCGKIDDPFNQKADDEDGGGVAFEDDDDQSGVVVDRRTVRNISHDTLTGSPLTGLMLCDAMCGNRSRISRP